MSSSESARAVNEVNIRSKIKLLSSKLNFNDELDPYVCDSSDDDESKIPDFEAIGSWGVYGINSQAWCDKFRPVERLMNYNNLELTDYEQEGYLSDRIIACCSSYLEKCPEIRKFVMCKCDLSEKALKNIEILKFHKYLQYLDLSWNYLEDVSALSELRYLMYLDVSYNNLEELLNFHPPHNLTHVNYSVNLIGEIPDLTKFWSIKSLNLANNHISKIEGLHNLKYLETLDLSFNQIECIENLDNLNIINLNLHNNKIYCFNCEGPLGLKSMPYLSYVRLEHNDLTSLKLFEQCAFLQSLDMTGNDINNLLEISYLRELGLLVSVKFEKNPIKSMENYESVCIEAIKNLKLLDGDRIELKQKISAINTIKPDVQFQAMQDYANLLTLSHLTKLPNLGLDVIPADQPTQPLIVVVSPIGSKQESLILKFAEINNRRIFRLINHIDRIKLAPENGNEYYFVSRNEFNNILKNGEFLMVYNLFNNYCGLTQDEYARGLLEPEKVMITHADLRAALALRLRGYKPFLVLALPKSIETHIQWLNEAYETCIYNIKYPEAAIKLYGRDYVPSDTTGEYYDNYIPQENTSEEETYPPNDEKPFSSYGIDEDNYLDYFDFKQKPDSPFGVSCLYYGPRCDDSCVQFYSQSDSKSYKTLPPIPYDVSYSCEGSTIIFPELLIEEFHKNVMKTRELYLEFHNSHPGIFYETIYTDEEDKALKKLMKVAKAAHTYHLNASVPDVALNFADNCIVKERLKMYENDMEYAVKKNLPCPQNFDIT